MDAKAFRRALAAMALAGMVCVASTAYAKPSGNWRIEFDNRSDNDGTLVLRIAPIEGAPTDVEIKIPANTSENNAAELVSASLKASLGSEKYRIGVDDGEDVVIKKRGKTKNFELTMVSTSLTGLQLRIKHN